MALCVRKTWRSFLRLLPQMSNLSQSVKGKMIFWRLDPLWSHGCPNPRVESNDAKLIFIFVLFNKYYCVLSKNFVTYSTATQIYISTTSKTAMTTSGKISKNIQFQNTDAGFTVFSVHSQHLKSSSSAFRPALSNLWLLLVNTVYKRMKKADASPIDHIHIWRLINYSFVFMIIILTSLVSRHKIQKNLCFKVRLVG